MNPDEDILSPERETQIEDLLRLSARWMLADPDPAKFVARLAAEGPRRFPDLFDERGGGPALAAEQGRFFRSFGWSIASSMPLPANDFQPRRLPLPGRNEPCLCGSLRKFKQCCAPLFEDLPALEPEALAAFVLIEMPRAAWAGLPATRVLPRMVLAAAVTLREDDEPEAACKLLEPWAKLPAPWPAARAELLDLLCDLYLDLDKPRKRVALAQAMIEHGDAAVQSAGWRRKSMMAADAGDAAASRAAFEAAQRLTPNDPNVALLEVTTLLGAGERERASERAAFHARRLARLPEAAALADDIAMLEALARGEFPPLPGDDADDEEEHAGLMSLLEPDSPFQELQRWVQALPAPKLRLRLDEATPDDLGRLAPQAASIAPLVRWRKAFGFEPQGIGGGVGPQAMEVFVEERWSALLQREPRLADSFEVLDGLVLVLDLVPLGLAAGLQDDLLDRAMVLWTLLRERFPRARCEWGHPDNRPALRLLARYIDRDDSADARHTRSWLQAMVEVLNPNDNHGFRERLVAVYLRRGEEASALALCERYPDDFVGMQLLHVRALLAAQRLDDAAAAFAAAQKANPHVSALLVARRAPRDPNVPSFGVGSIEQAKLAVRAQHDLWRDKAVQSWLAEQLHGRGAHRSLFDDAG